MFAIELENGIEAAWSDVVMFVPELAAFLVVLLICYVVAKIGPKVMDRLTKRSGSERRPGRGGIEQLFDPSGTEGGGVTRQRVAYDRDGGRRARQPDDRNGMQRYPGTTFRL